MPLNVHLRDIDPRVVDGWRAFFSTKTEFTLSQGDIFEAGPHDAIVSPANSFGYMDGGIDLVYTKRFGWGVQERLQQRIREAWAGELPVGEAELVETGDPEFPLLVSAPTMRVPDDVSRSVHAYLAFRAALLAIRRHNEGGGRIETVLCPGLATAVGRMPARRSAYQMYVAWEATRPDAPWAGRLGSVRELHYRMLTA